MMGEKQITRKKTLTNVTLSSKYHVWAGLGSNQGSAVTRRQLIAHRGDPGLIPILSVCDLCGWSGTGTGFRPSAVVLSIRIIATMLPVRISRIHPTGTHTASLNKTSVSLSLYGVSRPTGVFLSVLKK